MGLGGAFGGYLAKKMAITDLPQMVAGFHSLVGLAAVATSVASYLSHGAADPVELTATFLGALIGTITMTGSSSYYCCCYIVIITIVVTTFVVNTRSVQCFLQSKQAFLCNRNCSTFSTLSQHSCAMCSCMCDTSHLIAQLIQQWYSGRLYPSLPLKCPDICAVQFDNVLAVVCYKCSEKHSSVRCPYKH